MSACTRSIAMMCYRRDACRRGNLKYVTSSHGKAPEISDAHEARCVQGRRRPAVPRIMLTGAPGAGKTTLVCRIAAELQASGLAVAGFTSRELRERSGRVGFQVGAIGGGSAVMAHVGFTEGPRVGRYRVDVPAFERIACKRSNGRPGPMEWQSSTNWARWSSRMRSSMPSSTSSTRTCPWWPPCTLDRIP